jgi:hypothetical protein
MSVIYCPECGFKNSYTLNVPNFCGGCAVPLKKGVKEKVTNSAIANKEEHVELEDDETDMDYVPEINELQYEVSQGGLQVFKGGQLLGLNENDFGEINKRKTKSRSGSKKKNKKA